MSQDLLVYYIKIKALEKLALILQEIPPHCHANRGGKASSEHIGRKVWVHGENLLRSTCPKLNALTEGRRRRTATPTGTFMLKKAIWLTIK